MNIVVCARSMQEPHRGELHVQAMKNFLGFVSGCVTEVKVYHLHRVLDTSTVRLIRLHIHGTKEVASYFEAEVRFKRWL